MFEKRTVRKYEQAVERLLDRLDAARPRWLDRMPADVQLIDQAKIQGCVLGRVYPMFYEGRRDLRRRTGRITRYEHLVIVPPPWRRDLVNRLVRSSVTRRRSTRDLDREIRELLEEAGG